MRDFVFAFILRILNIRCLYAFIFAFILYILNIRC